MPTVKVGDINIYYEVHGEGETLVLISGYGNNSMQWFRQVGDFSKEYRVITFDNRGTGKSDKPDIPYTMEMMAGDVAGLLDVLGIDTAHIYGISMGGRIAQALAIEHPHKAGCLVLGCTDCGDPHRIIPRDEAAMSLLYDMERRRKSMPEEEKRRMILFLYSQEFIDNNLDSIEKFAVNLTGYVPPVHAYISQQHANKTFNAYNLLFQIKSPTLVITGDADRMVLWENSKNHYFSYP
ncbi:MAG: alpha/beta hydrolase [Dehalococcoidia bacterium]|nr:alpha/beta hydrolase [Dehalococcoidia bacterium]